MTSVIIAKEQWQCPVCLEVPPNEIFQCHDGHTICARCFAVVTSCPQCRAPLGGLKIRCRVMESLLDSMMFPCTNQELGCGEQVHRNEMKKHLETCYFEPRLTKFCEMMGFQCGFQMSASELPAAVAHFKAQHLFVSVDTHFAHVLHAPSSCPALPMADMSWTPVILKVEEKGSGSGSGSYAVVFSSTDERDFAVRCVMVADERTEIVGDYEASFQILNSTNEGDELKWKVGGMKIPSTKKIFDVPGFKIPLDYLKSNYMEDNQIRMLVSVNAARGGEVPPPKVELNYKEIEPVRVVPKTKCASFAVPSSSSTSGFHRFPYPHPPVMHPIIQSRPLFGQPPEPARPTPVFTFQLPSQPPARGFFAHRNRQV